MATALFLATPLFHPSQNREVSGTSVRKFNSSIFGEFRLPSCVQKGITQSCRSRSVSITSLFGRKVKAKTKRETVIPDPDYRIPIVLLGATGALVYTDNLVAAVPVGLLGLLLLVQATRVRFVFDDEALEVKVGSELKESGENAFVGGKNRWKYSTFVNWEFWWPNFPILVYFKETQTKPEGQIHFFPIIFNGKQLYDVMVERAGSSKTSGP
ncbi:hypothetical protein BVRB_8g194510 isoform A [Beta vulgaris subsp. vulgaris]|uniref:uncharacterized protein LOC104902041 isoform X2 n=1 Tax=Beta vulgaris subsp. vulgaris TaxID=3555 RepID=UPI0005402054|nr:uncharacterized protein LOC104902041 isoform X2 [Beta vulgaris subsp. vulgaris]KMT02873.1 hypothetical protein BVRB_8g194510 isoform A [Beta vulgaris subsp. vulgaris]